MHRPLLLLSPAFLVGCALGLSDSAPLAWWILPIAFLALRLPFLRPHRILVAATITFFVLGLARGSTVPPELQPPRLPDRCAVLDGVVDSLVVPRLPPDDLPRTSADDRWTFDLRLPARSRPIRVTVDGQPLALFPGDRVKVRGILEDHTGSTNPPHRPSSIRGSLRTRPSMIRVIAPGTGIRTSIQRARQRALHTLTSRSTEPGTAILCALLLGERRLIGADTRDLLRRTGVAHLLAISGLHVGLVLGIVAGLLRLGQVPPSARRLLLLPILALYAVWTDGPASVMRACVMATPILVAPLLLRRADPLTSLALAALVLTVARPTDLATPGFQLSFSAVTGLILFVGDPSRGWVRTSLHASTVAFLVTAPLSLHHFHLLAPCSIPLNLIALPAVALSLGLGALALGLETIGAGGFLLEGSELVLDGLLGLLELVDRLGASWCLPGPTSVGLFLVYGLLGVAVVDPRLRAPVFSLQVILVLLLSIAPIPGREPAELRATVLDVQHGLAVVLELPDGRTWLYDCGSRSRSRVGPSVVVPFLMHRRITDLDGVIVSHGDHDHLGGLADILEAIPVQRLIVSERFGRNRAEERDLLGQAKQRSIPIVPVTSGDRLSTGDSSVRLEVLAPPAENRDPAFAACTRPGHNEDSVVVRVSASGRSLLLPGDLEGTGLEHLLRSPVDLGSDAVLLPHHGSSQLGLEAFLRRVGATIAFGSAAREAIPRETKELLDRLGITQRWTGEEGALVWGQTNSTSERFSQHCRPSRRRTSTQSPRSSTSCHSVPACRGSSKAGS